MKNRGFLKWICLYLVLMGFSFRPSAQTISVHTLQANPHPQFVELKDTIDTLIMTTPIPGDTLFVSVSFKIDSLHNADSIFFRIGTTDGGAQTLSKSYNVIQSGGIFYLDDGLDPLQCFGRNVYLSFAIIEGDLDDYKYLQVWGRDNTGSYTNPNKFTN